ncbi:MAG: ExeM/NucH family extracellular endonuclease [Chloroflexi bacterium]|nr:ExeM/NucH family extracellular endonuclease [Chloroflexota bacterium]
MWPNSRRYRRILFLYSILFILIPLLNVQAAPADDLIITGVIDGPLSGGVPKAVELYVVNNISDLSIYGLGSANNGGGSDGEEFTFPAVSASAGSFIYVASETSGFNSFFGFNPDYTSSTASINGDDAIELFTSGAVSDVFGDINLDGTGQPWEYMDGWAYRNDNSGPDGSTFVLGNWIFSGPNALDGETSNSSAATPFPIGTYSPGGGGDSAPGVGATNPANGASGVAVDTAVTVIFDEAVAIAGTVAINCTTGGIQNVTPTTGDNITFTLPHSDFTTGETCTVTITAAQVTDLDATDPPDNMSADYLFSFGVGLCIGPVTLIHTIQGSGVASAEDGNMHTVEGVVVGDFQGASGLDGFYVQEENSDADADSTTSEGIFVFAPSAIAVNSGDIVRVTGTVDEYFELTELTSVTSLDVCSTGATLPTAVTLSLPFPADVAGVPYLERLEGMRVTVPAGLFVTSIFQLGRGGEFDLAFGGRLYQPTQITTPGAAALAVQAVNDLNVITIDDGSEDENPTAVIHPAPGLALSNRVRNGDTLAANLDGVLTFGWSGWSGSDNAYRVHTNTGAAFTSQNPRPATPAAVSGDIKVASFNVLNYFNGDGLGGGFPTPRGADTAAEFTRQRDKIIQAILTLDADIIGLMEIENDGYGPNSAIQDLVNGLNAIAGGGTYAFIDPGVATIGSDQIAVGMLYKPGSVTPTGTAAILDDSVDPTFNEAKNRPVLAQTFSDNTFGEQLTVAVNHLKSKGSACDAIGDPDAGDGQGNCNLTRMAAANAEVNWLNTDPTSSGDPDFMLIGDMNAYALEDPIAAFESSSYINLLTAFGSTHSYAFRGQFGHLDHALATASLTAQVTNATVWHINADEPPAFDYNDYNQPALYAADTYRASDHDPVLIGIDFQQQADFSDLALGYGVAWHTGNGAVRLGSNWDADSGFSNGSDNSSDDGMSVGSGSGLAGQWQNGAAGGSLNVTISGSGNGCLYAWIDWNDDGVFTATGEEYIIQAQTAGTGNYTFDVPAGTFQTPPGTPAPDQYYALRVRLYAACSSGPTGPGAGGEVEDYVIGFTPTAVTLHTLATQTNKQMNGWPIVLTILVALLLGAVLLMWRVKYR